MEMKRLKNVLFGLVALMSVLIIVLGGYFYLDSPPKHPLNKGKVKFIVNKGDSLKIVARKLKNQNLIKSYKFFVFIAKISRVSTGIKSGEYLIREGLKASEILKMLSEGEVVTVRITIPEGFTAMQIANMLESKGIVNKIDFINATKNEEILKKYGIPFSSAEGFLFPDTYIISKDLNANQIVEIMIKRFFEELNKLTNNKPLNRDELKKVIIIASLVEKEAKKDDERSIIAAVFYNRLKMGKRLQSCATVQYVLGKAKERLLYRDLKVKSPYNTYLHKGLPPGPISNPGSKSLWAAIHPANVGYLYFVSKHDGSHYFSKTYSEHLKAIKMYRNYNKIGVQSN